jgi:hypothetical protein
MVVGDAAGTFAGVLVALSAITAKVEPEGPMQSRREMLREIELMTLTQHESVARFAAALKTVTAKYVDLQVPEHELTAIFINKMDQEVYEKMSQMHFATLQDAVAEAAKKAKKIKKREEQGMNVIAKSRGLYTIDTAVKRESARTQELTRELALARVNSSGSGKQEDREIEELEKQVALARKEKRMRELNADLKELNVGTIAPAGSGRVTAVSFQEKKEEDSLEGWERGSGKRKKEEQTMQFTKRMRQMEEREERLKGDEDAMLARRRGEWDEKDKQLADRQRDLDSRFARVTALSQDNAEVKEVLSKGAPYRCPEANCGETQHQPGGCCARKWRKEVGDKYNVPPDQANRILQGGRDRQCYTCGSTDHISISCPKGKGCYNCSEPGHYARDCTKEIRRDGGGYRGNGGYRGGGYRGGQRDRGYQRDNRDQNQQGANAVDVDRNTERLRADIVNMKRDAEERERKFEKRMEDLLRGAGPPGPNLPPPS